MATADPVERSALAMSPGGAEKVMTELAAVDKSSVQQSGAANGTAAAEDEESGLIANGHVHEPKAASSVDERKAIEQLSLPLSSANGLTKKPLGAPLATSTPRPRLELSADQQAKYKTVLATVSQWTELPDKLVKGSATSPMTDDERMFLTRECLLRYLRADKWHVEQATTRLRNTLTWRREYNVKKLTPEYIGVENETGKQVITGWDNEGRPCQYLRPSKQNTERSDRQIEHLVFMLERTIDLMPPGQETLTLLINFAETRAGQGATLAQGKQVMYILQNHYPERLGRALVTNVPWYIWTFFKLITPFIDPLTREKIKFNEDSAIHVAREQLLKECGGLLEFDYDHAEYWPALNKLCVLKRQTYRERWEKAGKRVGEHEGYMKGGEEKSLAETEAAGLSDDP
ncbi:hypothetical protein DV736_g258, partial [Chaetothyriales sp. CBS 134916]